MSKVSEAINRLRKKRDRDQNRPPKTLQDASGVPGSTPDTCQKPSIPSCSKVQVVFDAELLEAWEERAAIAEFDGDLSREDAEALANLVVGTRPKNMKGKHDTQKATKH